ncbi:MAG: DUF559 domain-containing protein [Hyphomicrobiales bacterium]|nr:DUF559 domain-containing protein [Hyphomicrobiales bacterium]
MWLTTCRGASRLDHARSAQGLSTVASEERDFRCRHGWCAEYDAERTQALEDAGIHTRFTNHEIRDDLDGVLERIGAGLRLPVR